MAAKMVSNVKIDIQTGTDRTVYATWTWTRKNTDSYSVAWYYDTGDGVWFVGNDGSVNEKQSVYSPPSNAKKVKIKIKPVAKTHEVNKKDTPYWTASWSKEVVFAFKADSTPETPSVPTVRIDGLYLTAEVNVYDVKASSVKFQIVRDNTTVHGHGDAVITKNLALFTHPILLGHEYKVRCRAFKGNNKSEWSEYSENVGTVLLPPLTGDIKCKAESSTSAELEWPMVLNANSYDIEYTANKQYFGTSSEVQSMSFTSSSFGTVRAIITGLDAGNEWFFRIRAVNSQGTSSWSSIVSTVLGKVPAAPTTWSTTTTAVVGENVTLYWVHNSEDGSSQTSAEIELTVGETTKVITVANSTEEDEKDKTSSYVLATSEYAEGVAIQWRVRTKGVIDQYGDWSIQRIIDVYAPPVLSLTLSDTWNWHWDTFNFETDTIYTAIGDLGEPIEILASFPLYVLATAGPNSQTPAGYYLTISSNETYQTVDSTGRLVWVNKGEEVFSKHYDTSGRNLFVVLNANDLDLENNVTYTVHCMVSMDSGLTAEAMFEFTVAWTDEHYEPDAEIGIDEETYSAHIRPYCEDENEERVEGVILSVYRREFDGGFTELASGIDNASETFVTDPHPALDYARYRIVAMSRATGAISYYDPPGYPVGGIAVILQWDEEWTNFDSANEDEFEKPPWSGSLLKLPYNIDVSDSNDIEVSLVEYIGRKHPVSYYGTQLGQTSTWNVEIPSEDKDTIYALRRLSVWQGDVYVREPSGSGYWAHVSVSFSQKHCEVTIPVTLEITRVEGGI